MSWSVQMNRPSASRCRRAVSRHARRSASSRSSSNESFSTSLQFARATAAPVDDPTRGQGRLNQPARKARTPACSAPPSPARGGRHTKCSKLFNGPIGRQCWSHSRSASAPSRKPPTTRGHYSRHSVRGQGLLPVAVVGPARAVNAQSALYQPTGWAGACG
jgi:hypothetical protein